MPKEKGAAKKDTVAGLQVCMTRGRAYTLTEVMSIEPVGCAVNMKEDNEMAARRTMTVVESVAERLLTLA